MGDLLLSAYQNRDKEQLYGEGFYVSYRSITLGGDEETALCFGSKEDIRSRDYWILNGDHRQNYRPLIDKGLEACKKKYEELVSAGAERSTWSTDL